MITRKLNIISSSNIEFINNKQIQYSYAFRKLYKNIHRIKDPFFIKFLQNKFNLNDIEIRSLINDVDTKYKQIIAAKEANELQITEIIKDIEKLESKNKLNKKETRTLFKLNKKLKYKENHLSNDIVFGGSYNLKKISTYSNLNDEVKKNQYKDLFNINRILPIYIIGESNQKANRFFEFNLKDNLIIYKPNRKTKIEIKLSIHKSYKNEFIKLQELINNKNISISIRLSNDSICLTYDNEILYGYSLDVKSRNIEVSEIKNNHIDKETKTNLIKEVYKKYYDELRSRKQIGKLNNRYLSIDLNPNNIGCSIIDKSENNDSFKIIKVIQYDLTNLNKKLDKNVSKDYRNHITNKRKHGIYHIWKDIFKMMLHYKCFNLVIEDLNFDKSKQNDMNKESNRQILNMWNLDLIKNLINKYVHNFGFNLIEINACYSSTIGNLMYNYTDCCNASIEICRRGINKYVKNKFYPSIEDTIDYAMSKLSLMNQTKLRDVSLLKDFDTWKKIHDFIHETRLRYRSELNDKIYRFNSFNNLNHSRINKLVFI